MRHVAEVTLDEARAVPDGDPLARWAATIEALHAKCGALHARLVAVEADRDGALAQCETLTQTLREAQRERDALVVAIDGVALEFDRLAAQHMRDACLLEQAHERARADGASNSYEHARYMLLRRTKGSP